METKMNNDKSKGFTNLAIVCGGVGLFYSVLSLTFGSMARKELRKEIEKATAEEVDELDEVIRNWKV